jgi:hypothetical protein
MSPTETEKIVTGTDGVVVTVVVVVVVVDWVGDTAVDTGGVLVVFVSTGTVDVWVVAVEVAVGVVLFVQANTLVRTNKDRTNIMSILLDTDLFIFMYVVYPKMAGPIFSAAKYSLELVSKRLYDI